MVRFDFEKFAAAMFGAACRPLCVQAGTLPRYFHFSVVT